MAIAVHVAAPVMPTLVLCVEISLTFLYPSFSSECKKTFYEIFRGIAAIDILWLGSEGFIQAKGRQADTLIVEEIVGEVLDEVWVELEKNRFFLWKRVFFCRIVKKQ